MSYWVVGGTYKDTSFTELEKKRDELVSLLQKAGSSDEEANNEALSQIANIDKMLKKRKFL